MSSISVVGDNGEIQIVGSTGTSQVRVFNTAEAVAPAVVNIGSAFVYYIFNQTSASTTWNVTHNLARRPSVTVVDSAGTVVVGEVTYNSDNALTIQFSAGFSGQAYLN